MLALITCRYGDLGAAASVNSICRNLGSNMLDLVFHCLAHTAGRALEPQLKKVPGILNYPPWLLSTILLPQGLHGNSIQEPSRSCHCEREFFRHCQRPDFNLCWSCPVFIRFFESEENPRSPLLLSRQLTLDSK